MDKEPGLSPEPNSELDKALDAMDKEARSRLDGRRLLEIALKDFEESASPEE